LKPLDVVIYLTGGFVQLRNQRNKW